MRARLFAGLSFVLLLFSACKEEINTENRYTFTGDTVLSFLQRNDSLFRDYTTLLNVVKQSNKTESTVATLLSVTTKNYTCFAPTNEAVKAFLDSAYVSGVFSSNDFSVFLDSVKAGSTVGDSLAKVIVFNSIIEKAYQTEEFPRNGATFSLPNLKDRYLKGDSKNDPETQKEVFYVQDDSKVIYPNIEVENGYVHGVDKVISPSTAGVADLFEGIENMQLFGRLLKLTGWDSISSVYLDQSYEDYYQNNSIDVETEAKSVSGASYPEHRKYGFTIFAETDDVISDAIGLDNPEELVEKLNAYLQGKYSGITGVTFGTSESDLKKAENAINQFVAYHILPVSLPAGKLVHHYNEKDYDPVNEKLGIPVYEFYETISLPGGPRRLLKISESKASGGKRLNRKAEMDLTTYQELSANPEGILIGGHSGAAPIQALNGYVYQIDEVLIYTNETETVFKDRLRFDVASLLPELINLGYRRADEPMNGSDQFYFPQKFVTQNIQRSTDTKLIYRSGRGGTWSNYQGDEISAKGNYDVILKLPPVPTKDRYEIRLGFNGTLERGMCQVYFGAEGSTLIPTDVPLVLRMNGYHTNIPIGLLEFNVGWEQETDDQDYNERVNKTLRTKGWMKGPRYFYSDLTHSSYEGKTKSLAYNYPAVVRKILTSEQLEPNEVYYIRFKSALEDPSAELQLDYIELVPSVVYNDPSQVEDEW